MRHSVLAKHSACRHPGGLAFCLNLPARWLGFMKLGGRVRYFWAVMVVGIGTMVLGHGTPVAAQKVKVSDIPVHSYFLDQDAGFIPYTLQSDGLGAYVNGVGSVVSVLMANVYNNLYNGDWQMDASSSTTRKVGVTLSTSNAVPAGSPGYTVAPNPPFWGMGFEPARLIDKCTQYNKSVLTMQAGSTITCPIFVRWDYGQNSSYRLDMGGAPIEAPESTAAQISCNSADAVGCRDWYIDPIPVVNPDGTVSAGKAIARLVSLTRSGNATNLGDFYMTFHFHITRP
jgi:hypothetical protein